MYSLISALFSVFGLFLVVFGIVSLFKKGNKAKKRLLGVFMLLLGLIINSTTNFLNEERERKIQNIEENQKRIQLGIGELLNKTANFKSDKEDMLEEISEAFNSNDIDEIKYLSSEYRSMNLAFLVDFSLYIDDFVSMAGEDFQNLNKLKVITKELQDQEQVLFSKEISCMEDWSDDLCLKLEKEWEYLEKAQLDGGDEIKKITEDLLNS